MGRDAGRGDVNDELGAERDAAGAALGRLGSGLEREGAVVQRKGSENPSLPGSLDGPSRCDRTPAVRQMRGYGRGQPEDHRQGGRQPRHLERRRYPLPHG